MIRLLINNQEADLGGDFDVKLTRQIADIREPENRQSDYSKTFTLPGTKTNHRLLSHIFDIGYSTSSTGTTNFAPDYNANLKAPARLEVDGVEQINGFIRVLDIEVVNGSDIVYRCSLHGQMADLFAEIGNSTLAEIDFSEFNHTLTRTNVTNSWNTSYIRDGVAESFAYGSGYVHLLVDRGRSNNLLWNLEEMTPAIYAKEIVDKIFSAAGYSYSTDSFFNDTYFKHLVVPMPGDGMREADAAVKQKQIGVVRASTAQTGINYGDVLVFNDDTTGDYTDIGNNYDTATGIYTIPAYGQYQNWIDCSITLTDNGGMTTGRYYFVELGLYVGSTLLATVGHRIGALGITSSITAQITELLDAPVSLVTGEELTWRLEAVYESTSPTMSSPVVIADSGFDVSLNVGSSWWSSPLPGGFAFNETLDFTRIYAGDYKQRDFLKSLFLMFNLYAEPDADNPKKLIIKPYSSFYGTSVIDLHAKLDHAQPLKIEPMGELDANPYRFTYKEDKDVANSSYQGIYSSIYGDKIIKVNNDFVRNEKKIEVSFSPTPVQTMDGMTLPWIEFAENKKGGALRILYYGGLISCPQWGLADYDIRGSILTNPPTVSYLTSYPYAGHLDSPTSSTADLCFGMPLEVNYPVGSGYTNANLYNTYWRQYINEITDRDSKVVSGYFRITPADMQQLSFRNLYFFEGHYFRLNKIEDYDPANDGLTYCEFFKIKASPAHSPVVKRLPGGFDTTDSDGAVYPTIKTPILTGSAGNGGGGVYTGNGGGTNQDGSVLVIAQSAKVSKLAQNVAVVGSKDVYIGPVRDGLILAGNGVTLTEDGQFVIGEHNANTEWLVGGSALTITTAGSTLLSSYGQQWYDMINCATASAGAAITVKLPDPATIEGRQVVIRNEDGVYDVLVELEDGSIFDGQATHYLRTQGQSLAWRASGGAWRRYDSKVTDGGTF